MPSAAPITAAAVDQLRIAAYSHQRPNVRFAAQRPRMPAFAKYQAGASPPEPASR